MKEIKTIHSKMRIAFGLKHVSGPKRLENLVISADSRRIHRTYLKYKDEKLGSSIFVHQYGMTNGVNPNDDRKYNI